MAFIGNLVPHRSNTEHDFILTRRSVLRHCTAVERIELWARGGHHGPRVLTTLLQLWGLGEIFGGGGRGLSAVFTCSLVMVSKNKGTCRKLPGIFISNIKKPFFLICPLNLQCFGKIDERQIKATTNLWMSHHCKRAGEEYSIHPPSYAHSRHSSPLLCGEALRSCVLPPVCSVLGALIVFWEPI